MNKQGLIGQDISYSYSPIIYDYLFKKHQLNSNYEIYNMNEINKNVLLDFKFGNITIPFKNKAYQLAGNASNFPDQSINCFKNNGSKLEFISTDQYGIISSIEKLKVTDINQKNHVIFGDGATAKMIASSLNTHFGISNEKITFISRKIVDFSSTPKYINYNHFKKQTTANYILYNATPLGTREKATISPFTYDEVAKAQAIFDVTYNPNYNQLAKYAHLNGVKYINGIDMLVTQGLHAFKFWTGFDDMNEYENIKKKLYFNSAPKMIICGMPFAGKTTIYSKYNKIGCDLDLEVEKITNQKNSDYIKQNGIDSFREKEVLALEKVLIDDSIKLIFLGGGTLTNPKAINLLTNEVVLYMEVELNVLKSRFDDSRANIQSEKQLEQIYFERDKYYNNIAKIKVEADKVEGVIDEYLDNKWS